MDVTTNSVTTTAEHLKTRLVDFCVDHGMDVIAAATYFCGGDFCVTLGGESLQGWLDKHDLEPPVKTLFVRVVKLLVMIAVLLMVLQVFKVPIGPLVAGLGVAGVGIGLALQGVLSNLVAGLLIIFTKPFRVGEYIELAGVHGQVKNIELFSTVLTHSDLSNVVIPNRKIVGEILHNYGKIRQLDLSVGVAYGTDPNKAIAILREILAKNPRVLKNPVPGVGISMLSDSSINISVKPWASLSDAGAAGAEIYAAIIEQFRVNQIEIPFPQREVRLLNQVQG
ncbi:mechanosensitive ion channel family protein [Pedosphaera parvula]|uniref:MscS Mechanosensitive ion channel n=1 Tax=Pedosphaera parvula (strain Ellin514) TaxID=320771 RepID=B9XFT2_PEDPL|nr:mechanosensitive ion channel family protein [Pedosphaera parvula]EEF61446.1 MscS Mechanosensitive ion channel [Pedosphaera parvula Ellin514]